MDTTKTAQHDYMQIMMNHTPVGMVLYDTQDFRILSLNAAMLQSLARNFSDLPYKGDEIIGQPLSAWFTPSGIQEMTAIFRSVAESGIPFRRVEYPFRLPDGSIAYWNWSLQPVTDEQGHIIYLLHSSFDVTEEVKARIEARTSHMERSIHPLRGFDNQLLRSMLDHIPEGILIADVTSGSPTYVNEAAASLLSIPQSTLMRMPLYQHIWSHRQDVDTTSARDVLEAPFSIETTPTQE